MDPIAFFGTQEGFIILIVATVGVCFALVVVLVTKPKGNFSFLFERLKPGFTRLVPVKEERLKNPGDIVLHLPDKRKYIVPSGKEGESETLEVQRDIKIRKGWRHFWWLEGDRIVKLGWSLLSAPTEVMDHQTATVVANRRTAGKLSTKNLAAGSWTTVILAAAAALAVGYILYPQFNHPATVIEYCNKLANGTITGCSPIP